MPEQTGAERSERSGAGQRRRQPVARRRALALQIRREGGSYESIASRLGTTRQSAQRMVTRQLAALAAEDDVEARRQLHIEALKELWRSLAAPAARGDLDAIDRFLAVERRIAQLAGLDAAPAVTLPAEPANGAASSEPRHDDMLDDDVPESIDTRSMVAWD